MKTVGKQFEEDFKNSLPNDIYYLKLQDSANGFDKNFQNNKLRFSAKSPYDVILCKNGRMYAIEQKSVADRSISYGESKNHKIKKKQVENLLKAEQAGAVAGLLINFRGEKYQEPPETYFIKPSDFLKVMSNKTTQNFKLAEARECGVLIPQTLKKVHYRYDFSKILDLV